MSTSELNGEQIHQRTVEIISEAGKFFQLKIYKQLNEVLETEQLSLLEFGFKENNNAKSQLVFKRKRKR